MFICSLIYSFSLVKLSNAAENRRKIMYAIDAYVTEFNDAHEGLRLLFAMKDFCVIWIRFWDWGYTRILPKEDFELIKPYLEEKQNGK
jgi:hypothetical protein